MALLDSEKPVYARIPKAARGILDAATAGTLGADTNGVVVYTADTHGGRVESLVANTDDSAAVNLFVYLIDGSSNIYPLGICNVPLGSGDNGTTANVDILSGVGIRPLGMMLESNGKRYILVPGGWSLKVSVKATMTAAKKCWVTAQVYEYTDLIP